MTSRGVAEEYASSLADLTINSKPLINMLTMLADDYIDDATNIVQAVEKHLQKVRSEIKLPVLYLIDSIVKNVGKAYTALFTQNIVATFCSVFEKVDEKTRAQMFKLRQTWNDVFPAKKLYAMDARVNMIDPAWPITAQPPGKIHVNPRFLSTSSNSPGSVSNVTSGVGSTEPTPTEVTMREQLLKKQKELLELQQKKLELELLQTKARLEEQQKQLEKQTTHLKADISKLLPTTLDLVSSRLSPATTTKSVAATGTKSKAKTKPLVAPPPPTITRAELAKHQGEISVPRPAGAVIKPMSPVKKPTASVQGQAKCDPRTGVTREAAAKKSPAIAEVTPLQTQIAASASSIRGQSQNVTTAPSSMRVPQSAALVPSTRMQSQTTAPTSSPSVRVQTTPTFNLAPPIMQPRITPPCSMLINAAARRVRDPRIRRLETLPPPKENKRNSSPPSISTQPEPVFETTRLEPPKPKPSIAIHLAYPSGKKPKNPSSSREKRDFKKSKDFKLERDTKSEKDSRKSRSEKPVSKSSKSQKGSMPTKLNEEKENSIEKSECIKSAKEDLVSSINENVIVPSSESEFAPVKKLSISHDTLLASPQKETVQSSEKAAVKRKKKSPTHSRKKGADTERVTSPVPSKKVCEVVLPVARPENLIVERLGSSPLSITDVNSEEKLREARSSPLRDVTASSNQMHDRAMSSPSPPPSPPLSAPSPTPGDSDMELGEARTQSAHNDKQCEVGSPDTKDFDLRAIQAPTAKKRPSVERQDQPPTKKSKAEIIDALFGDVDLRQEMAQPQPPTPPPPPVISAVGNSSSEVTENGDECSAKEKSWANYKQTKPDTYKSPHRQSISEDRSSYWRGKEEVDRLGRPLLYNKNQGMRKPAAWHAEADLRLQQRNTVERNHSGDISPSNLESYNYNYIISTAEKQLKSGDISFSEYNEILKKVITMNEKRKLREAQERDEAENGEKQIAQNEKTRTKSDEPEETGQLSIPDLDDDLIQSSFSETVKGDTEREVGPRVNMELKCVELRGPEESRSPSLKGDNGLAMDIDERKLQAVPAPLSPPPLAPPALVAPPEAMEVVEDKQIQEPQTALRLPPAWEEVATPWQQPLPPPPPMMLPPAPPQLIRPSTDHFSVWRLPLPPAAAPLLRPPMFDDSSLRFARFVTPSVGPGVPPTVFPTPMRMEGPLPLRSQVPPSDPMVLELIAADTMRTINIDSVPREIRFYGETAIVMMAWNDPREIDFQGGSRRLIIDDKESAVLQFNSPYREMCIGGKIHRVRFGAPTRELYFDGKWYECYFGSAPISLEIDGTMHKVVLEGPPPTVRINPVRNTSLVVGKIHLIVDASVMFPIFLDAKPQRFEVDGVPYILRFVEALQTVVINGCPFKIEFGGLPIPINFRGKKHYIGLSALPQGVRPGYVTIVNMEGGRLPSPPPPPPIPHPPSFPSIIPSHRLDQEARKQHDEFHQHQFLKHGSPKILSRIDGTPPHLISDSVIEAPTVLPGLPPSTTNRQSGGMALELLASVMPTSMAPSSGFSYTVEQEQKVTPAARMDPKPLLEGKTTSLGNINITELFQKLVATGIVATAQDAPSVVAASDKSQSAEDTAIKPVDFAQPETLKVRQTGLVTSLYSGIQCSSCGERFPPEQTVKYSQHLDWHFRQNRRDRDSARTAQCRKLYYDLSDWVQFEEIEDLEERAESWFETQEGKGLRGQEDEGEGEVPSVAAGENNQNVACEICHDKFEQFYNEEKEEWHLRKAIREDDKVYHPLCYQDFKALLEKSVDENDEANEEETKEEVAKEVGINDGKVKADDLNELEVKVEELKEECIVEVELTTNELIDFNEKETADRVEDNAEEESEVMLDMDDPPNMENFVFEKIIIKKEPIDYDEAEIIDDSIADDFDVEELVKNVKTEQNDDDDDIMEVKELVITDIIKKELDEPSLPNPVVDTTHTAVACSIDGNVKFDETPQQAVAAPSKIKINITKPLAVQVPRESQSEGDTDTDLTPVITSNVPNKFELGETTQPPPPGIEPCPFRKSRMLGKKLVDLPLVSKGTELSGLCSIM